jgi:RNA polymerase sigma-54 factor
MKQGLRLDLRQTQQLVMTPQLQQAIRLLQMSNLELAEHVRDAARENPLIRPEPELGEREAPQPPANARREIGAGEAEAPFDTGRENLYEAAPAPPRVPSLAARGNDTLPDIAERRASPVSLRDSLHAQLGQTRLAPDVRRVAALMVEALEPDGYLREDTGELAARIEASPALVDHALAALQACEPAGVGARTLAECLALQLAATGRLDPMMQAFLDNLDLVAKADMRRLATRTGADAEDLAEMLAEIRRLDPRPGLAFGDDDPAPRVPDILMRRARAGGWEIELNPDTLPRISLDRNYAARLDASGEVVDRWIAERRAEAAWLSRTIDKRASTILAVTAEIVRQQDGFFEEGVSALRPLTLKAVAERTGLHESTVSRVTANKHLASPRGIFELKFFFTNAVGDGEMAAETVRQRLKALVEAEPPDGVLSDDALVETLRREGVDIARRTVAKYRKMLAIPSSVERRRRKALAR